MPFQDWLDVIRNLLWADLHPGATEVNGDHSIGNQVEGQGSMDIDDTDDEGELHASLDASQKRRGGATPDSARSVRKRKATEEDQSSSSPSIAKPRKSTRNTSVTTPFAHKTTPGKEPQTPTASSSSKRYKHSSDVKLEVPTDSPLSDLTDQAHVVAKSITATLGGSSWISQSVGGLGPIKTKSYNALVSLRKVVEASLEVPGTSQTLDGRLNTAAIEALGRAFEQRQNGPDKRRGPATFDLSAADYEVALKLLEGRIKNDGECEREVAIF